MSVPGTGSCLEPVRFQGDNTTTPSASQPVTVMVSTSGTMAPTTPAMTLSYGYDADGNPTTVTDANAALTQTGYDSLARATSVVQPVPKAGASAPTIGLQYDLRDQPTQVTDPRHLPTNYTPDGLGNVSLQTSPDTGPTQRTFYDNGLLKTSKDARNLTTSYGYDALDRLTTVSYASGPGITYTYDDDGQGHTAIGRLVKVADESGKTAWTFDAFTRVVQRAQTTGPANQKLDVSYTYGSTGSANGKLQTVTYPSGAVATYGYDAAGRVSDITVTSADGSTTTKVLGGIAYTGASQPLSWAWGVGNAVYQRGYDGFGRLASYPLGSTAAGGVVRTINYDPAGRIVGYAHTTPTGWDETFGYDGLDRLINSQMTASGETYGYDYDDTGNRKSEKIAGAWYTLTVEPASNRYSNVQLPGGTNAAQHYDAAGHLQSDPNGTYTASARGRLSAEARANGNFSYLYNGLEQRVYKSGPTAWVNTTGTAYYAYDEAGHLLGEYDATGLALYETVYLGDTPVAVLTQPAAHQTTVSFVYADHLNTARVIVRPSDQKMVWTWGSNEPFGQSAANDNPSGLGVFIYNPRFPGQVADKESGWFYNWHRDYDPSEGRYVQSDPVGLDAGPNTYAYVEGAPLGLYDFNGLTQYGNAGAVIGGWGGRAAGAAAGEVVDPLGGGIPGAIVGARAGSVVGRAVGEWAQSSFSSANTSSSSGDAAAAPDAAADAPASSCPPPRKRGKDCNKLWAQARAWCGANFTNPIYVAARVVGPTMDACVRGQVPRRCGGSAVEESRSQVKVYLTSPREE